MRVPDEVLQLLSLFSVPVLTLKFSQPLSVVLTPEKCQASAITKLVLHLLPSFRVLPAW